MSKQGQDEPGAIPAYCTYLSESCCLAAGVVRVMFRGSQVHTMNVALAGAVVQ